jgi:hypothetical protein
MASNRFNLISLIVKHANKTNILSLLDTARDACLVLGQEPKRIASIDATYAVASDALERTTDDQIYALINLFCGPFFSGQTDHVEPLMEAAKAIVGVDKWMQDPTFYQKFEKLQTAGIETIYHPMTRKEFMDYLMPKLKKKLTEKAEQEFAANFPLPQQIPKEE